MTYEEAIHLIDIVRDCSGYGNSSEFKFTDAFNEAIEVLEKQIAKKPIVMNGRTFCPRCYENKAYFPVDNWNFAINLSEIHKEEVKRLTYCKYCGQAIDWSDDE